MVLKLKINMKKLIVSVLTALTLTFAVRAENTNSLFNAGEVGVGLSTGYDVGQASTSNNVK